MEKEKNVKQEKKACNLIIIGNGFDLLLGLPTRFSNFIDFCKLYDSFVKYIDDTKEDFASYDFNSRLDQDGTLEITEELMRTFPYVYDDIEKQTLKDLKNKINNSKLINHCIKLNKDKNYKWKDFERYLLFLCESFEEYIKNVEGLKEADQNVKYINKELKLFIEAMGLNQGCFNFAKSYLGKRTDISIFLKSSLNDSRNDFVKVLYRELIDFNEIFNVFIKLFICKIPSIKHVYPINNKKSNNFVLNFNYTFNEQLLGSQKCNHPHGLTIDDNLIIGINSDILPIEYMCLQKKFLSINNRIDNWFNMEKDRNYYDVEEWFGECQYKEDNNFSVIVVGHSLDSIDDYILKKIFNHQLLGKIVLYYYKEDSKISLLSNICRIMGYDRVEELLVGFPNIIRKPINILLRND